MGGFSLNKVNGRRSSGIVDILGMCSIGRSGIIVQRVSPCRENTVLLVLDALFFRQRLLLHWFKVMHLTEYMYAVNANTCE
jgi:hypothetical protein